MIFALIFIISADFASGELKLWTTNEETYAAKVATLVTTKYDAIIAATDALKPETDTCAVQVNATADACQTCLTTVVCSTSGSSDANEFLGYMKGIDLLGTGIEVNLVDFANKIAAGAEILYNKYGAPAFTALSSGLESVGEVLQTMGIAIESGLKVAFDVLGTVFTVLFNRFKDEYFGRRRRDTMIEEDLEVRIKRATNSEAKQCLSKCSDCSAFEAGEQEAATRAICGDSLVEEQKMLEASAAKLQAFYTDWESAKDNLIAEVYVDTSTNKIVSVSVLKEGVYITLNCASANIKFNSWNQDPTYEALVDYIYTQY